MDNPALLLHLFNSDAVIARLPNNTHGERLDWTSPLYMYDNALNPEFMRVLGYAMYSLLGLFALVQLAQLAQLGSKRTVNKGHSLLEIAKYLYVLVFLAGCALLHLESSNYVACAAFIGAVLVFPAQYVAPTVSVYSFASVLIFWLLNSVYMSIALAQDTFSSHIIIAQDVVTGSLVVFVSWAIFVHEYVLYEARFSYDKNQVDDSDVFATFTFSWIYPLINRIHEHEDITQKELPSVSDDFRVDKTFAKLDHYWQKALKNVPERSFFSRVPGLNRFEWARAKPKPSLFTAVFLANIGCLVFSCFVNLLDAFCSMAQPWLLRRLLLFFDVYHTAKPQPAIIHGFVLSMLMFGLKIFQTLVFQQMLWAIFRMLFAVDSSLTFLLYQKAMRLSPQAKKDKTTGDIINHVTMDVSTVKWFVFDISDYVGTPIRLVVAVVLVYRLLGFSVVGGLACGGFLLPFVSYVTSRIYLRYNKFMEDKDKRTSFVNELLTTIKSTKFYSWEKPMAEKMMHLRDTELASVKSVGIYSAFSTFLWDCVPFFLSAATYATYAYMYDTPLTPDVIFPAMALFDLLSEPVLVLPRLLTSAAEALTSFGRLTDYLIMDEIEEQEDVIIRSVDVKEKAVEIKNASFLWGHKKTQEYSDEESAQDEASPVALKDLNFLAKRGELTCIVGRVGAGKTTLLRSILGEIPVQKVPYSDEEGADKQPSVEINGTVAYCPQSPWILNASVKENILFGFRYDPVFYQKTVEACQLLSDFKSLPDGDHTIVGEKGISLSGGQKARISLARAVYSRADIFLLDDVLSAVDAHVGKAIVKNVLSKDGIIGDRTKILATNSVSVLHKADVIYLLEGSTVSESGNFEEVKAKGQGLAKLIEEFGKEEKEVLSDSEPVAASESEEEVVEFTSAEAEPIKAVTQIRRASAVSFSHTYTFEEELDDDGKPVTKKTGQIEEFVATGGVKFDVIWEYCKACDYRYVFLYLGASVIVSLLSLSEKYVFTVWSNVNQRAGRTENPQLYIGIYVAIGLVKGVFVLGAAFVIWTFCILNGSRYFHNKMMQAVMRAPMSFFETTPLGRILNRFTDDVGTLDQQLPWMFIWFFSTILNGLVTLGVVVSNMPILMVLIAFLLVAYNYVRGRYIPAARQLRRIVKTSKSPILSTIQESINGVDTISAFNQMDRFLYKSKNLVDTNVKCQLVSQATNRWLSVRLQLISSTIMLLTTLFGTYSQTTNHPISTGLFGFIMTYALGITSILNAIVRSWAEIETQSVSIERISEYCKLTPEAPMVVEDKRPAPEWPQAGAVAFSNYSCRYRDNLPPVLKNISLSIAAGEKIGIVGRTGAGKSSLTLALFRIIEPIEGIIDIDSVDVTKIGLYDLRSHLNIIPQESHVVKGSVRENLDPFGQYSDEKLWRTLELAHLKEHIEQMKTEPSEKDKAKLKPEELQTKVGLDAILDEGGANLSAGQKQLLSLARALLNETARILVLDEATASVDVQTDKVIQTTIRSEFKDKTILTIAHRLETVMDSDKVLVLDKGEVKEFASPDDLLKDQESMFYSMCKEGGYV